MPEPASYSERLTVPLRWWVQATMLVATFWLAVAVATPVSFATGFLVVAALLVAGAFLSYGGARIEVADGEFRAGRAHIPVHLLGEAIPLDAEQTRLTAGRDADARAYLVLRPYVKRSVRVEIADPADPTPYWLVSSRNPQQLAAALQAAAHPA